MRPSFQPRIPCAAEPSDQPALWLFVQSLGTALVELEVTPPWPGMGRKGAPCFWSEIAPVLLIQKRPSAELLRLDWTPGEGEDGCCG